VQAQFGSQQIISAETDKAYLSIPVDVDNDGFIDVLSAQVENHRLVWFRNLDGLGNFGSKITLTTGAAYSDVLFVDVDTDGDNDILLNGSGPGDVSWLENLDGLGNFVTEEVALITNPDVIRDIRTLDFDNDGDLDIIANVDEDVNYKIVWYENLDGEGNFGEENILATHDEGFFSPLLVDIDGDGDLDILTSKEGITLSKIVWYENLGNTQVSGENVIYEYITFTNTSTMLYADINTDGKKDIVISYFSDGIGTRHGWLENLNNNGSYNTPEIILHLNNTTTYYIYDLDNDADNDVLLWNSDTDTISWIENANGLGVFNPIRTITTEVDFPRNAQAADIDGDGLLDVISASLGDDKVAWYKNSGILGLEENSSSPIIIYPNPAENKVYFNTRETIKSASITSISGKLIKALDKPSFIDLSELSTGVYFITLTSESGHISVEKIIKK